MRRITSLTAALTFLLVVLTSIVLYIVPQGRVAYWADWRLWGLSKTDWGNIHINLGFLFLIALGLHIYYNWKPLMAYLKDKARRFKLFTREFNIALAITVLCTIGSYFLIPPFSWVMALNDHFKETASAKYGEPPYGHAELSTLKSFTGKMNLDLASSLVLLEESGYSDASADATLAEIAKRKRRRPTADLHGDPTGGTANGENAGRCQSYARNTGTGHRQPFIGRILRAIPARHGEDDPVFEKQEDIGQWAFDPESDRRRPMI